MFILRVALYMAFSDTKARYKRSVLGPWWLTLGTAIGALGLGVLWSILLREEPNFFIPNLLIGLIIWQFIAGVIIESPTIFVRNGAMIRNISLPYMLYPAQLLLKHFINFSHSFLVFIFVALYYRVPLNSNTLFILPGLIILLLNLLWISVIIGMLGARFRDVELFIAAVMPLIMFISPIFYRIENLPYLKEYVYLNPFYYYIELIRGPLMGRPMDSVVIIGSLCLFAVGALFAFVLFKNKSHRISYWV